jgi:hypothetical protein
MELQSVTRTESAMAVTNVDVVGSTPLSFTNSDGAQKFVPLSALQFSGSDVQLKPAWTSLFNASETQTMLAVAKAKAAGGELTPPPVPPPKPAVQLTATHAGPESNNIVVTATPDPGPPLTATIAFTAKETDAYSDLASGAAAARAIGVDVPTGADGDPDKGTGLVVVKSGSVGSSTKPAVASSSVLTKATGVKIKDADGAVLFTLLPRADYVGTGGLSYAITADASGNTFTLTASYDSTEESGKQAKVTIQTLDDLPHQLAYLATATAPPGGAALPKAGSVQLSGGDASLVANGLLYTP